MADDVITTAPGKHRPQTHILRRPVLIDHIEIGGSKVLYGFTKIARQIQCLKKDFRHDHRRTEIQDHAAVIQP